MPNIGRLVLIAQAYRICYAIDSNSFYNETLQNLLILVSKHYQ